jgi:hypothetical protein
MIQNDNFTKSLGSLRINKKTKPKSPDLTGTAKIHRLFITWLWKRVNSTDADAVECNLAAWQYRDKNGPVLSVEISERYVGRPFDESINIFDQIARQQEEDQD